MPLDIDIEPNEVYYDFVERDGWPEGPWDAEPDKMVWVDDETGLDCMINRNRLGAWCGYVGVPEDHPLHSESYWDVMEEDINAHGGLTFSDSCREESWPQGICHKVLSDRPDNIWWIGFDCQHGFDAAPGIIKMDEEHGFSFSPWPGGQSYKDVRYVVEQVQQLARQLKEKT